MCRATGIPARIANQPIGKTNDRPMTHTGAGTQTVPPVPLVGWGTLDNPYCCGAGKQPRNFVHCGADQKPGTLYIVVR